MNVTLISHMGLMVTILDTVVLQKYMLYLYFIFLHRREQNKLTPQKGSFELV